MTEITIRQPNDSNKQWKTTLRVSVDGKDFTTYPSVDIYPKATAKDPIHDNIYLAVRNSFTKRDQNGIRFWTATHLPNSYEMTLFIGETPIYIQKTSAYYVYGKKMTGPELYHAIARILFKSCFEKDPVKLLPYFYSKMQLPEKVRYVIENRVPYFFYDSWEKVSVRLNVMQIGDEECAIEIGDGVWGNISIPDLVRFCNFYVDGRKRSKKFMYISPENLYEMLTGNKPSFSDSKVLRAFLSQNRQSDIVEKKAMQLVKELLADYPKRLRGKTDSAGAFTTLLVKGHLTDWKLHHKGGSSRTQSVQTFAWSGTDWAGPICIDNMGANTPTGDQFASRALALLNDNHTVKMVSTIKSYIKENKNRKDLNEYEM